MNYIDLILIVLFGIYVWQDYRRGFLQLSLELVGLILAFVVGLKYYGALAAYFTQQFNISFDYTRPLTFLLIWILIQAIFYSIARLILYRVPIEVIQSTWNRFTGLIPALIKGIIFLTMLILLVIVTPTSDNFQKTVKDSFIGSRLVNLSIRLEHRLSKIFDEQKTAVVTNKVSEQDEITLLDFSSANAVISPELETQLLAKTNLERAKVGAPPLSMDTTIQKIARAHSQDMFAHGYFSHNTLDGKDVLDRLLAGQANFQQAAENIAFGPNIDLANTGLMNSATHRANILNPNFTRVGIGVAAAEGFGTMITEDFAN